MFFIAGILVSGISVYALSINARDTAYDNTTSGSSATNMQDAIDDLYEKAGSSEIIDLGEFTGNKTLNISDYYSGDFSKFSAENFMTYHTQIYAHYANRNDGGAIRKTYDSTTGKLILDNLYSGWSGDGDSGWCNITYHVYLITKLS